MKHERKFGFALLAFWVFLVLQVHALIILDDNWADGTRSNTSLPNESAWYSSTAADLTASLGALTGTVPAASSRMWLTYFTSSTTNPVQIADGQTIKVSLFFTPSGVAAQNANRGFRFGLFNFSDGGTRQGADGFSTSSSGLGVKGYMLNQNFGVSFGISNALGINRRTNINSASLMGTSSDFEELSSGAVTVGSPAFSNNIPYTLEFSVFRNTNVAIVTIRFSNTNGWSVTNSVVDANNPTFSFDGVGIRPARADQSASSFRFSEYKVELNTVSTQAVAPTIFAQPQNQTATIGQTASFDFLADGDALKYQWFFNDAPLAVGTNRLLTISNVQTNNAGFYHAIVTNNAGSATSSIVKLTVETGLPIITLQPRDTSTRASQSHVFAGSAKGNNPLSYQWFSGASLLLAGATNSALVLTNLQPGDAGNYFFVVTNTLGSVTSTVATLRVKPTSWLTPDFNLVGFAGMDGFATNGTSILGGTVGGAGGNHVQAWSPSDLHTYLTSSEPLLVEVMTNIDMGIFSLTNGVIQPTNSPFRVGEIRIASRKTLYSKNGSTISHGIFRIIGDNNVIIRNLKFRDLWEYDPTGEYKYYGWDYIGIENGAHHVWVDHCDFERVYDGVIDIKGASDFITISWNVFRHQNKCHLVGASDSDFGDRTHLNVTFHHNFYFDIWQRTPRARFGNIHVYNLYCEYLYFGAAIQSTTEAATLVENVFFLHPSATSLPTLEVNAGPPGTLKVVNSIIVNSPSNNVQFRQAGESTFTFNSPFPSVLPPYSYTLDPVSDVPLIMTNYTGVGKIGFELWRMEHFSQAQLNDASISGSEATPAGDSIENFKKYALGLFPLTPATNALTTLQLTNTQVALFFRRPTPEITSDVVYQVKNSTDLSNWTSAGITHQLVSNDPDGLQTWAAICTPPPSQSLFLRLEISR